MSDLMISDMSTPSISTSLTKIMDTDTIGRIMKMKGRDLIVNLPELKDLLFKRFEEDDKMKELTNMMNSYNYFEFVEMVKISIDSIENESEKASLINIISMSIYMNSNKMTEEQIKAKEDTERIFNYEFESERLTRFTSFLKDIYDKEVTGIIPKNPYSTFMLIYNMKKTFILMKRLNHLTEEQYIDFVSDKLGYSIDNIEKISTYMRSPSSHKLSSTDKSDVVGFLSNYTNIPKEYSTSKIMQNRLFSDIDTQSKKYQMVQRMLKKREEKKRLEEEEKKRLGEERKITTDDIRLKLESLMKDIDLDENREDNKKSSQKKNKSKKSKKNNRR